MKKNVWHTVKSFLCMQGSLVQENGHSLVLVPKRSGILWKVDSPQGIWDNIAEKMLLKFAESGCPIFRATTSLSRGKLKSKGHGKLSIHFAATQETIEAIVSKLFLQISSVFTEQSRKCVKNMNPFTIDQGNLIKLLDNQLCSVKSRQKFLWWMMIQHIKTFYYNPMKTELRGCHNKIDWVNFVRMQGFLSDVEIGQYFVTKDTDLTQFNTVACRDYTLPIEKGASQPRGWI